MSDIPLIPYFAQLDDVYPGSKFILTVRDMDSWLDSVGRHWQIWRDRDPNKQFTDFVCACVYGTLGFSPTRFQYVYEFHVNRVREYFLGRDSDLLEMNIVAGDSWSKLCGFLGLPVPDTAFPRLNERTHNQEWARNSDKVVATILDVIPEDGRFILIDDGKLALAYQFGGRALPFLERHGAYFGLPPDSDTAVVELERLRSDGAKFVVMAWPSFWWRGHFAAFVDFLDTSFERITDSDVVLIWELRSFSLER